jgi:hypothetical protein
MRSLLDPHWFATAFFFFVQFLLFLRWLHRQLRHDEVTRVFVHDIATNHLPHIYFLLQKICRQQGIDEHAPPLVQWVDLTEPNGD